MDEPKRILIIEDNFIMRGVIARAFQNAFPDALVDEFMNFSSHDFEDLITKYRFAIIAVDGDLSGWRPHPVFGTRGENLARFITEYSPKTLIVGISNKTDNNRKIIAAGAAFAEEKSWIIHPGNLKILFNDDLTKRRIG